MKKLLKISIPVLLVAAAAVPASGVLMAPKAESAPVVAAAVEAPQDADPLAALMAGNVVGRRGCLFGRRLPTSFFLP